MRYLILATFCVLAANTTNADLIIDDFTTTQKQILASNEMNADSIANGAGIIGGQRFMSTSRFFGPGEISTTANLGGSGNLAFTMAPFTTGGAEMIWGGTTLSDGLSFDLTQGNTVTGIGFNVLFNEVPIKLTFKLTDTTGNESFAALTLAGGTFTPSAEFIPFSAFANVNPHSIDAITMHIARNGEGAGIQIDAISATTPEPSSVAFLAVAGITICNRRRRKR